MREPQEPLGETFTRLAAVLDLARPPVIAGLPEPTDPGLAPPGTTVLPFWHRPSGPDTPPPPAPAPPAWKAPTSGGSTGRPKIIVAGEPGTFDTVVSRAPVYRIEPDGTFLCTAPLFHNAASTPTATSTSPTGPPT